MMSLSQWTPDKSRAATMKMAKAVNRTDSHFLLHRITAVGMMHITSMVVDEG